MTGGKVPNVLGQVGMLVAGRRAQGLSDQELLACFLQQRDESAFAALMERHGAMVLGVCRRILKNAHDAEDACQAVFLVLARKASSVRKQGSLSSWLHGVAWRVARKLRCRLARRIAGERLGAAPPAASELADLTWREVKQVLDDELNRLPDAYKAPLVLCHLQGRTLDEAARELGWSLGSLRGRLERGREKLRARLVRRGLTVPAVLAVASLAPSLCSAAVPPTLVVSTVGASLAMAAGGPLPAGVPDRVVAMTREFFRAEFLTSGKVAALFTCFAVLGMLALWVIAAGRDAEDAASPQLRLVEGWSEATRWEGHKPRAWCVAYSPDGKRLAVGSGGFLPGPGVLRLCDAASGQVLASLDAPHCVRCVAFSPDGNTLATAEHDGSARLRDGATGKVLRSFQGHKAGIDMVSFSADGKTLATSSWDKTVKLWDTTTAKEIRTLTGHAGQVFGVAFGAGDTVASAGLDRTARIWNAATGEPRFTLRGHNNVVHWVAFTPDGKTLATASWDRTVKLWAADTGKLLATLRGHTEPVLAVAFSPDGWSLASCAGKWADRTTPGDVASPGEVIVWDVNTHKARSRWRDPRDRVLGVAFSPDGTTLACAGWDGSVTLSKRGPVAPAAEPEPPAPNPDRFFPLKGEPKKPDELELIGPGAAKCVRFEAEGLRITLPTGVARVRANTGVRLPAPTRGDFEATVSYQILAEPATADSGKQPTKLALVAVLERAEWTMAMLTRRVSRKEGLQFTAWTARGNHEDSGKRQTKYRDFPAKTKVGRLRIVRSGAEFSFWVAEGPGAEFVLLHQLPAGEEDLQCVEVIGSTGGPQAALDVRFTDLRVRTGSAVQPPAADESVVPPMTLKKAWLQAALLVCLVLALVVLLGLHARRRRRVEPPGPPTDTPPETEPAVVSFACSGCGKRLKTRAQRAGKKVKCPGCGVTVVTPPAATP